MHGRIGVDIVVGSRGAIRGAAASGVEEGAPHSDTYILLTAGGPPRRPHHHICVRVSGLQFHQPEAPA